MAQFGRISSELLHDMGNALSLFAARIAVVREEMREGRSVGEELASVQGDAEELRRMVMDVLDELRGPAPHRARAPSFDPAVELERTVDRWYQRGTGIAVRMDSSLPLGTRIAGPPSLFTRMMANLLRNASRHARKQVRVTLAATGEGTEVQVRVEDDGAGIPADLLERLFAPFESGVAGGHGLGLSFCQWSAERLGGALTHEGPSPNLGGAAFLIRLPVDPRDPARSPRIQRNWSGAGPDLAARPLQVAPQGTGGPGHVTGHGTGHGPGHGTGHVAGMSSPATRLPLVLVLDDEAALCRVFVRRLARSGFEAQASVVQHGDRIPDVALRAVGSGTVPDLVLVDLNLGIGSGMELAMAIESAAVDRGVPVPGIVLMTGGDVPAAMARHPFVHKLDEWEDICRILRAELPLGRDHPG